MVARVQTALSRVPDDAESEFARDVVAGLSARPKRLSPKYFYDERGAQLFEEITRLPEYYPTRCELAILENHAADMAKLMSADTALIEFGSGSTRKARILLDASPTITAYVPVDISSEMLQQEATELRHDYPRLTVIPVEADFTKPFRLPRGIASQPRVGFFPGSTIGNFEPHAAAAFLKHAAGMLGSDATLIVGFDLVKDVNVLNAAYNDAAGVTARFNLNLLTRINRELDATFDLDAFSHQAFFNVERRRIEMHLASRKRQRVRVAGRWFEFRAGETIHTESSYKYTPESFVAMARGVGWTAVAAWSDPQGYFSVHALARQSQPSNSRPS
jgi:L-histidine Nalpha-methyltransferase